MQKREYEIMYQVEDTHFWFRGMRAIMGTLIAPLTLPPLAQILDAGCGTGANLLYLRRFGHVTGIDFSPHAVRFTTRRGLKVHQGSIDRLPYRARTFDLVTCFDVFDAKTVNRSQAITEFYRVLKPGGYLIIHVPAYQWLYCSHDELVHTARRFTTSSLSTLMRRGKLTIARATYSNTLLFPLEAMIRLARKYLPFLFVGKRTDIYSVAPLLNFFLSIPLLVESFLLRFFDLPFGLSVIVIARRNH